MKSIVCIELQAAIVNISKMLEEDYTPIGLHNGLSQLKDNLGGCIEMLEDKDNPIDTLTEENSIICTVSTRGLKPNLITVKGDFARDCSIDITDNQIISRILDSIVMLCDKNILYVKINIPDDVLSNLDINATEVIERMVAFSSSTGTVVILPPHISVMVGNSSKEESE